MTDNTSAKGFSERLSAPLAFAARVAAKRATRPDQVYFILCRDVVKIGSSVSPEDRLKLFQIGNPYKLTLLNSFPIDNAKGIEYLLHDKLVCFQLKGEWFWMPKKAIKAITNALSLSDVLNVLPQVLRKIRHE